MPSNDQADVIRYLNRIHDVAAHACGSAPAGMAARWAQNYIDNDYNRRQDELDLGAKGDNTEGGASLVVRNPDPTRIQNHSHDTRAPLLTEIPNSEDRRQLPQDARHLEVHSGVAARHIRQSFCPRHLRCF